MKKLRLALSLAFTTLFTAAAQDVPTQNWGGLETQGSFTFGYRHTSVGGRVEKFNELFDLQSGPRLFDFSLSGNAKEGASPFADRFSINASGLGGDPFPSEQLTVSKSKVYDLRASFRQTYYYWDQNDNAVQPSGLHGLTTNQNWATVRRFGSANLLIHATNRLKFRFEYGRTSRDGVNDTTRTLEYFNSPSSWGTFLRDNPYYVAAPLLEHTDRVAGGLDYTLRDWSFHYTVGYQTFDQSLNWNVTTPEHSINVDSTANRLEFLNRGTWNEYRHLKTPSSEFSYNGQVNPRLTLRGSFLVFRYSGPVNLDAAFAGTVRANSTGTQVSPYNISLSSHGQVREPDYVVDQGFSLNLNEWATLHGDYRYNRFTEESTFLQRSNDGTTAFDGTAFEQWRQGLHQADLMLELTPIRSLIIRPGIRFIKRDTTALDDGVADPIRSERLKSVWPIGSVAYVPARNFSVRADLQSITNGQSYTRITPHTSISSRWVARYEPIPRLSLEESFTIRNSKLVDTDFRNHVRSNAFTVSWSWTDKLSTFAGFSYDSFLATASVTFLRGTPPINTTWRDQTINRVWQAGLTAKPLPRLGFDFAGNFVRTTGVGEITGELPAAGPLTFPMGTATAYYDLPRLGKLAIDVQRTYYFEEIVRGNDFGANLLTFRWTRNF
jgi:hypothetical protein